MTVLEKTIEKAVCDYAKQKGMEVYKFTSPARVGVPDRLFLAPHQHAFFIEFKRPGGKPTAVQEREAKKIAMCGFNIYLVDDIDKGKSIIDNEWEEALARMRVYTAMMQKLAENEQQLATKH